MIREILGWVTVIGIILLVAFVVWMAFATLISYSIQRYFELKEEYLTRISGRVVDETENGVVQQVH